MAKLRLMRQDAAAKGAQLDTLLGSSRARLEAMLGCRGQGTACHHPMHICSSVQGATPTSPFRATKTGPPGALQLNMLRSHSQERLEDGPLLPLPKYCVHSHAAQCARGMGALVRPRGFRARPSAPCNQSCLSTPCMPCRAAAKHRAEAAGRSSAGQAEAGCFQQSSSCASIRTENERHPGSAEGSCWAAGQHAAGAGPLAAGDQSGHEERLQSG